MARLTVVNSVQALRPRVSQGSADKARTLGTRVEQPQLTEIFAATGDAGAIGFALTQIPARCSILWVQDGLSAWEMGHPQGGGVARYGVDPGQFTLVRARNALDVLWSMEEGLRCQALGAVIAEIWGEHRVLDFTASKRLALYAERTGVHAVLIRFGAAATLSAARRRWRVVSDVSAPHSDDAKAPGYPRWRAELFRARDMRTGSWEADYDPTSHRLDLSAAFRDPALAPSPLRAAGLGGGRARGDGA